MAHTATKKLIDDLVSLLERLESLHKDMTALYKEKLSAIGKADIERVAEIVKQENRIACEIQERDGLRRQIMDKIGQELGMAQHDGRALSLSQLAGKVSKSQGAVLLAMRERLRSVTLQVSRVNRIAQKVSRTLLGHLGWVFEAVRPRACESACYTGQGAVATRTETCIVDAVG